MGLDESREASISSKLAPGAKPLRSTNADFRNPGKICQLAAPARVAGMSSVRDYSHPCCRLP